MFGYIKPFKPDLKVSEFEIYKANYCRLCKCLGENFGIISKLLLNYDCNFLAMISIAKNSRTKIKLTKKICTCNPLKRCSYVTENDESFKFAAAVDVIMSYYKICDNIMDAKGIKKLKFYPLKFLFSRSHKRAAKLYPEVERIVQEFVLLQRDVENSCSENSIDKSAQPTAAALSKIFSLVSPDLKNFGYFLGRWVYIIDAADDLEKDVQTDNFNPLKNNLSKEEINLILNQTVFQIIHYYDKIEELRSNSIIDNIVKLGLAKIQKDILFREDKIR